MTRFQRPISASHQGHASCIPTLFCQPMRPCSANRLQDAGPRGVGAFSAVSLGTPLERGGTMTAAIGMAGQRPRRRRRPGSYAPSPVNEAMGSSIWSSKGPTCEPSSTSLVVNRRRDDPAGVGHRTPMCSLRHDPAPARTVLLDQPFAGARQLQPSAVDQQMHGPRRWTAVPPPPASRPAGSAWNGQGIARSRPSRRMTEPISPSVCRRAKRKHGAQRSAPS